MKSTIKFGSALIAITVVALIGATNAQDYDGETETAITGLSGLSGFSGLSGLSALANGVVTGYAPMSGSDSGSGTETIIQGADGRGISASESSDAESGDYDEDSNDSSASEEHPILSKFFNLISGGRHKRSIPESVEPRPLESAAHTRVKRGYKGWVPYVSTYVKTDKKANFKWGVKAKVGKKYGR